MTHQLTPYLNLLSSFVAGNISGTDLESQYFSLYKNETTLFPDEEFLILDKLFGDIDAFVAEPNLRDEDDLDEEALQEHCLIALEKLEELELESNDKFWKLIQERRTQKSISRAELERRLNNRQ